MHDTGKGVKGNNHAAASTEIAKECLGRLELDPPDREVVLFLISHHLELSSTLRRDIFDPSTVKHFADKVGTPERLKMLCLLTYADIKAVNPEALTPWKAENIWQLYIGAANYFVHSVDERVHGGENEEVLTHLRTLAPAAGKKLEAFLDGLPRRYLPGRSRRARFSASWKWRSFGRHNRYRIYCRKHELPFQTVQNTRFRSIEDVHLWMIDQHLGRRSISDFQRGVLALRKREIVADRRTRAAAAQRRACFRGLYIEQVTDTATNPPLDSWPQALAKAARLEQQWS